MTHTETQNRILSWQYFHHPPPISLDLSPRLFLLPFLLPRFPPLHILQIGNGKMMAVLLLKLLTTSWQQCACAFKLIVLDIICSHLYHLEYEGVLCEDPKHVENAGNYPGLNRSQTYGRELRKCWLCFVFVFTFCFWRVCSDRIENINQHKKQRHQQRHAAWDIINILYMASVETISIVFLLWIFVKCLLDHFEAPTGHCIISINTLEARKAKPLV